MLHVRTTPRARLRRISQHSLARFALFGAAGLAFDMALLALLSHFTPLPPAVAVTLAFAATYGLNFVLNRRFSFGAAGGHAGLHVARFAPQVAVDYVLTIAAVETLMALGAGLFTARVLAATTNAVFNYCTYRWWTFRPADGPGADPPVIVRADTESTGAPTIAP